MSAALSVRAFTSSWLNRAGWALTPAAEIRSAAAIAAAVFRKFMLKPFARWVSGCDHKGRHLSDRIFLEQRHHRRRDEHVGCRARRSAAERHGIGAERAA